LLHRIGGQVAADQQSARESFRAPPSRR